MTAMQRMRERHRAAGLCADCSLPSRLFRCPVCRVRQQMQQGERRERLNAAGLCARCGREPCRPGRKQGEACARYFQRKAA